MASAVCCRCTIYKAACALAGSGGRVAFWKETLLIFQQPRTCSNATRGCHCTNIMRVQQPLEDCALALLRSLFVQLVGSVAACCYPPAACHGVKQAGTRRHAGPCSFLLLLRCMHAVAVQAPAGALGAAAVAAWRAAAWSLSWLLTSNDALGCAGITHLSCCIKGRSFYLISHPLSSPSNYPSSIVLIHGRVCYLVL